MTNRSCRNSTCSRDAEFWCYVAPRGAWEAICHTHAEQLHPSTEIKTWLFSGYMKPIELGRPDGPPGAPETGREAAFRAEIDGVMNW